EIAPSGSVACLRTPSSKSAYGRRNRSATARETAPISAWRPSSSTSLRPATPATTSTVRSSWVGPRPPETTQRSASSPSRSAASSSSGRSPTIVIRAGSSPSDSASPARNGPFRSVRSPRTSSLPVTTIAARGRREAGLGAGPSGDDVAGRDDQAPRLRAADDDAAAVQLHGHVLGRAQVDPEPVRGAEPLHVALRQRAVPKLLAALRAGAHDQDR